MMKISEMVIFLEETRDAAGDLEVQSITGFWVQTDPATGRRVVVPSVGEGRSVEDALRAQ